MPEKSPPEELLEKKSFSEKLEELMTELHITRKHVFLFLGGFLVIVLGISALLFGVPTEEEQKTPEKPVSLSSVLTGTIVFGQGRGSTREPPPPSVRAPGTIGREERFPVLIETGVESVTLIGRGELPETLLGRAVMTLRKIENAYETNIDQLLNQSKDRRGTLERYLVRLRSLEDEGRRVLNELNPFITELEKRLLEKETKQKNLERSFFQEVSRFNPVSSEELLETFIAEAREGVSLKAQVRALSKAREFLEVVLPRVAARSRDIDLNREALIKGIKVFDVKDSDLKLIIPTNQD